MRQPPLSLNIFTTDFKKFLNIDTRKSNNYMDKIKSIIKEAEIKLQEYFKSIDEIVYLNQEKVLNAFKENRVGQFHLHGSTGYGHDDLGRELLEKVYSTVFKAEKALVRPHFASGTHTLACVLYGLLRPGDTLVSIAGTPYDTLHEVIGIRGERQGSLKDFGIFYREVPLTYDGKVNINRLNEFIDKSTKLAFIQRSRGYSWRYSISINELKEIIQHLKKLNPDIICFVDNCYGEFTEELEPTDVGADIVAGSLIKNPGGGIALCGGYIAGKKELVNKSSYRLYAPGIGTEGGATYNFILNTMQGLFISPSIVGEALKGAILCSLVFEQLGFEVSPKYNEKRTDIIQAIKFNDPNLLKAFCKGIQKYSPIDSYVDPIGAELPGYEDNVIMAGGTFVEGSTIELSADGPLRPPYIGYWQGGLNYSHCKLGLYGALSEINNFLSF